MNTAKNFLRLTGLYTIFIYAKSESGRNKRLLIFYSLFERRSSGDEGRARFAQTLKNQ
jgi:hypothetical protein